MSNRTGISIHMKTHKAAKHGINVVWFSCDQDYCDFKSKRADYLKQHTRDLDDWKPYPMVTAGLAEFAPLALISETRPVSLPHEADLRVICLFGGPIGLLKLSGDQMVQPSDQPSDSSFLPLWVAAINLRK